MNHGTRKTGIEGPTSAVTAGPAPKEVISMSSRLIFIIPLLPGCQGEGAEYESGKSDDLPEKDSI